MGVRIFCGPAEGFVVLPKGLSFFGRVCRPAERLVVVRRSVADGLSVTPAGDGDFAGSETFFCPLSLVSCLLSLVPCPLSLVPCPSDVRLPVAYWRFSLSVKAG